MERSGKFRRDVGSCRSPRNRDKTNVMKRITSKSSKLHPPQSPRLHFQIPPPPQSVISTSIPRRPNSEFSTSRLGSTRDALFEDLRLHQPIPIMHHQGILPGRNDSLVSPLHQLVLVRLHGVVERLSGREVALEGAAEGAGVVDGVVETLAAICTGGRGGVRELLISRYQQENKTKLGISKGAKASTEKQK